MGSAQNFVDIKSIRRQESAFQKLAWHLETDKAQIRWWRKGFAAEFFNVECEFGANVTMRTLIVGHGRPELASQFGKFHRGRGIDGLGMTNRVSQIVRQGADGKRKFVHRVGIAKEPGDEVARTSIVRKIAEELLPKRIVAHVLNGGAAVRVGMRFAQLLFGRARESRQ